MISIWIFVFSILIFALVHIIEVWVSVYRMKIDQQERIGLIQHLVEMAEKGPVFLGADTPQEGLQQPVGGYYEGMAGLEGDTDIDYLDALESATRQQSSVEEVEGSDGQS